MRNRKRWLLVAFVLMTAAPLARAQDPAVVRSEVSVNVRWFGAVPNDGVDDGPAFRQAIAAVGSNYGRIYVPRGFYNITGTLQIQNDRVSFEGDGKWATTIYFTPVFSDTALFEFGKTTSTTIVQCSLRRMAIASTNTTTKKIAVRLIDTSEFAMEDVAIGPIGAWTGADSIGVQIRGRDLGLLARLNIAADIPIKVEHNAHYSGAAEDLDVWHFQDLFLTSSASNYALLFDDGVSVTSFVLDGSNDFGGGKGGIYWNDTNPNPPGMAYSMAIRNLRIEGVSGGWLIYLSTVRAIRNVTIENVMGGTGNGFYFRGVWYLQLLNTWYGNTGPGVIAFDIDNLPSVSMVNCFWNTGTQRNIGNMRRLFAVDFGQDSGPSNFTTEFWHRNTNDFVKAGFSTRIGGATDGETGANLTGGSGLLNPGDTVNIPTAGGGANAVFVQVWSKAATHAEGGTALISSFGAVKLSGTPNFDVTGGANKLWIDTSLGYNNVVLRNATGEPVNYGFSVWWN